MVDGVPYDDTSAPARIVVADADDAIRLLYRNALIGAGCDVVEAANGRAALATAFVRPPALVVTELRLPVIDGFTLCEILRLDRLTTNVPILVVTTETSPSMLARAKEAGADAVLVKPIPLETLTTKVRELFAYSKELRERSAIATRGSTRQLKKSAEPIVRSRKHQMSWLARSEARERTTAPPIPPPGLTCPACRQPLHYEYSYLGRVIAKNTEQWDHFSCASCGIFLYRQRTGKLRRIRPSGASTRNTDSGPPDSSKGSS